MHFSNCVSVLLCFFVVKQNVQLIVQSHFSSESKTRISVFLYYRITKTIPLPPLSSTLFLCKNGRITRRIFSKSGEVHTPIPLVVAASVLMAIFRHSLRSVVKWPSSWMSLPHHSTMSPLYTHCVAKLACYCHPHCRRLMSLASDRRWLQLSLTVGTFQLPALSFFLAHDAVGRDASLFIVVTAHTTNWQIELHHAVHFLSQHIPAFILHSRRCPGITNNWIPTRDATYL